MSLIEVIIGPIVNLIDKTLPTPRRACRKAGAYEATRQTGDGIPRTQLSGILAEAQSADPWTSRARPSFLYVINVILLWAVPMGLVAAAQPEAAANIATGI